MEVEDARDTVGEPAGEEGGDDAEKVIEERDTGRGLSTSCEALGELSDLQLCNDERSGPFTEANTNPGRPTSEGVRGHVS